jgi:chromate transporter
MTAPPPAAPSWAEALRFWWRLGWISFGGPAGQIAFMHSEVVERRRWIDDGAFLRGLDYCMLLPGPEAQQLATYLGWRLHGVRGGVAAGALFVLPATLPLWLLSWLYVRHGARPALAGALLGALLGRLWPGAWPRRAAPPDSAEAPPHRGARASAFAAAACFALWLAPLVAVRLWLGPDSILAAIGMFFARTSLVTFGGAYAVLPYVAQHAVEHHHWLTTEQMIVGLGLAETTPGPLIMVLEYVGFVAAWQQPGAMAPLLAATLGALLTVWATFLPSFGLIFGGAPYIERLDRVAALRHALAAITAAVIGVIANLALWFGAAVLYRGGQPQVAAGVIAVALYALLRRGRLSVPLAVLVGALAGALVHALGWA